MITTASRKHTNPYSNYLREFEELYQEAQEAFQRIELLSLSEVLEDTRSRRLLARAHLAFSRLEQALEPHIRPADFAARVRAAIRFLQMEGRRGEIEKELDKLRYLATLNEANRRYNTQYLARLMQGDFPDFPGLVALQGYLQELRTVLDALEA